MPSKYILLLFVAAPTHYVIKFYADDTVSIVPRKRVIGSMNPGIGDECEVKWQRGDVFSGVVMAAG